MNTLRDIFTHGRRIRSQRLRDDVLATFRRSQDALLARLRAYDERDWRTNYLWLDASGIALYLLDRLTMLGCEELLPSPVHARLQQNLTDNRARTETLFLELLEINRKFHQAGLLFANVKGITLSPDAVPDPALRCQLDLDFLISAEHATAARWILESMGYLLHVVSGDTWDFRAGTSAVASVKDLYRPKPQRTVELHLLHPPDQRLTRLENRSFYGQSLPVLSPADRFLGQAVHLFGHVSSAFTRAAWALEYQRLVLAHRDDAAFWALVEQRAKDVPQAALAIGVVTVLASELFGQVAPPALDRWTVDRLPPAVRLWVEIYGRRAMVADFPGTKLYLLLQTQIGSGKHEEKKQTRRHLLPLHHWPPMISHGQSGEALVSRMKRYDAQLRFVLLRVRFHMVENIRYALESWRWRRRAGLTR